AGGGKHVLEGGDVGADPRRSIDDFDGRRAGQRPQAGGLLDLILEARDDVREVDKRGRVGAAVTAGDVRGDLLGASPVDRRLSGCHDDGLLFPIPPRGVLRRCDLLEIPADEADNRQDRNQEQDHAEPVVEDDGDHGASVASGSDGRELFESSTDATVAVEVLVEALLDPRQQAGWHFVIPALGGDDLAQLGLEIEGLQAVAASGEVCVDGRVSVLREGAVEEGLELTDGVLTVIHWSAPSPVDCRWPQPGLFAQQSRTTSCASLFFPDATATSRYRLER